MKTAGLIPLLLALCVTACHSERTVYDQYGNVVTDSESGGEKDLYSTMEERFNAAFSEKKNKDGVPVAESSRVSAYQKDIDNSHTNDKKFYTKSYGGISTNSFKGKKFAESDKGFAGGKSFAGVKESAFSPKLRPDFMNANKGLAHKDYLGAHANKRSAWEGEEVSDASQRLFIPNARYNTQDSSTYVESRSQQRAKPRIIDHRQQGQMDIEETRRLLGRDSSER